MNRGRGRNFGGYSTPRGRSWRPRGSPVHYQGPVGADGSSPDSPSWQNSEGSNSKQSECTPTLDYPCQQDLPVPGIKDICSQTGKLQLGQNLPELVGSSSRQPDYFSASGSAFVQHSPSLSVPSVSEDGDLNERITHSDQTSEKGTGTPIDPSPMVKVNAAHQQGESSLLAKSHNDPNQSELDAVASFDICPNKSGSHIVLKAPLFSKNREKRNENKRSLEGQKRIILRPGMVLLKSYISCSDQVKIVKRCRDLGLGSGGFYQPGYRDGAKLQLKMMCLGMNWDPEEGKYGSERPVDGAKPPPIPAEFYQLVKDAILDSHALVEREVKGRNAADILPWMTPNVCIVNFYTTSGRLGLHQDKDESSESLRKQLPVVSFSVGDSAEFLYGDERDTEKAEKVLLESGDVLLFGGKSRHIFHGVSAIHQNSAPKALLEETQLRPGRLNLTFREF